MGEAARWHLEELEQAGYSAATIANRDGLLRRLTADAGDPLMVTAADVSAWWATGPGLAAAQTQATYLAHLRAFYRWCRRHGLRGDDPTRLLLRPRIPVRLPRPVPHALLLDLLDLLEGLDNPDDVLVVSLMGLCGLRCAEVAAADREDYDGERLWVHGKGDRTRAVPVPSGLAAMLAKAQPGALVRNRRTGRRVTAEAVSARYSRLLRRHGIPATAHQLRHHYGTEMYARLRDLRRVQMLMGHASPATTAGYVAVDVDDVAGVVEALATR